MNQLGRVVLRTGVGGTGRGTPVEAAVSDGGRIPVRVLEPVEAAERVIVGFEDRDLAGIDELGEIVLLPGMFGFMPACSPLPGRAVVFIPASFVSRRQPYEDLKFWIDSIPRACAKCRNELRELKALQQEYDRDVASAMSKSASVGQKERLVDVIKAMEVDGVTLAEKVIENRRILLSQIEKSRRPGAA